MGFTLFSHTPSVTVLDNRGLSIRNIEYHRHPDTPATTDERLSCQRYNHRGSLTRASDPRFQAARMANFEYLSDLTGNALRVSSLDAGLTLNLSDAAGRPVLSITNARAPSDMSEAITRRWVYEAATLPGRPLSVTDSPTGGAARVTERFVYAGNSAAEKARNLAGACVSHYDPAGLEQTDAIALTGTPLSVTRRLLKDADNPAVVADWQGNDASAWNDLLGAETLTTLSISDATGTVLTTTDARGNVQRVAYDVAGLLSGSWLTLKGGKEQAIVKALTWSAAGQKLREEHGNGVVTTYAYEPETQRLAGIKTERPAGHASGAKVLQDLRYEYDPVGNVLTIRNDAEETRFWRNQKVVPENTYVYDSLYQLVSATGREMAGAGQQTSSLPSPAIPVPTDNAAMTNYTRTYTYDQSGNLTRIRHTPATGSGYTTDITISNSSNRGLLRTLASSSSEVEALFTAGGQQKQLQPGQNLTWTPRNELQQVSPVQREGKASDSESYRYASGSQRVLKVSTQQTGNSTQTQRALYLPGLELRTTKTGSSETESLQVITVGDAGRAQVRVLHWAAGKPADIGNDGLRYSYDNLTGGSQLELDGSGNVISQEEYYPYGGTAVWAARSQTEANYKTVRYSGKERDATGLYYYGYRYYQPWAGRWLSADPAGTIDGLNLFRMCRNSPVTFKDSDGCAPARPVPKNIWHIWIGPNALKDADIERLKRNANKNPDYTTTILTDSTFWDGEPWAGVLQQGTLGNIKLLDIMETEEGKRLTDSKNYKQYHDAVSSGYAAAGADILRYYWLKERGGVYLDHDDTVESSFGDIHLSSEGIGLSGLYRMPTSDESQLSYGYSLSHFAVQPGSKVLAKVLDTASAGYSKKPGGYYNRLVKGADVTTNEVLESSGNILFTKVINANKGKLKSYYNNKLKLNNGEIDDSKIDKIENEVRTFERTSFPLRMKVTAGNAHTWMSN
ncbi:RHS repeat-associated core domain-containing protein [Cedecea neteri]|uniref:RHS repeat-associated core domain-containing protein n=1 Tax=Cedecea neteri TaxID=158822 RepID=UPI0009DEB22E|nr:RHS repeat-associated core domain-containing protein [Cedecea neteri]